MTSESQYFDVDTSPGRHNETTSLQEMECNGVSRYPAFVEDSSTAKDALPPATETSIQCPTSSTHIPQSASSSSVVSRIKDSVEDLPSLVRRVSQSERSAQQLGKTGSADDNIIPTSPTLPHIVPQVPLNSHGNSQNHLETLHTTVAANPSPTRLPHQRHKRNKPGLCLDLSNTTFDAEHKKLIRPLSPFTSGGFLRRLVSNPESLTTSVVGTEIQPNSNAMVNGEMKTLKGLSNEEGEQQNGQGANRSVKPTQVQRGVSSFKSFISKTIERRRAT